MDSPSKRPTVAKTLAKPPYSIPSPGAPAVAGETIPRRHPAAADGLVATPSPDINTTYELVRATSAKYGNARAMGSRRLLGTHVETKKIRRVVDGQAVEVDKAWTYFELGPYEYMTFAQYEQLVLDVGAGLRALDLSPVGGDAAGGGDAGAANPAHGTAHRVHLYAATSANWLAMSHGAASQSLPVVTAYDTLGEAGVTHSMRATGSRLVFLDPSLLSTMTRVLQSIDSVRVVVWNDHYEARPEDLDAMRAAHPNLRVVSFSELRQLGKDKPVPPTPPRPDDLCCIMYTSGSTGNPRGVMLKHRNVVAAVAGVTTVMKPWIGPGDSMLAYLPSAHILEFVFENASLVWGCVLGYGNAKTLSDASVRNCNGDIREFRPSVLVGVPAVFETVKKGILAKVEAGSAIARRLFHGAMWLKPRLLRYGMPGAGLLDAVVFKKLREATGGRLRITMNGGGPVSTETREFISIGLAPMIMGYGLTETTAMGCLQSLSEWNLDTLGAMPSSIEIKLVDFPDAGYLASNKPHPQGEIWIRGPSVMAGYHDNAKETDEAISPDGWLRTGDIGEFNGAGHLRIIDRKKNLVKSLNGEYIAIEKLESVYRSTPVVANICVYADASQAKPVAIVVAAEPALRALAGRLGLDASLHPGELVHDKKVRAAVLAEMQAKGRAGGLTGIEIIDGVVLTDDEWTPQNELLTAAQKLVRNRIVARYDKEIKEAYGVSG
jgi:long-chain acyl-CoA synthetase